jgi:hypothetical protein
MKASDLAQKIELAMPAAFTNFAALDWTKRSQTVMTIFRQLGHDLGFRVCCKRSSYPSADDTEWMYDQMWYEYHATKQGFMITMPMALESEWKRRNHCNDIGGDFHKLVQATSAHVRVWISQSVTARRHIDACKDQICQFDRTSPGDEWVFAVYDWLTGKPLIERFTVTQNDLLRARTDAPVYEAV